MKKRFFALIGIFTLLSIILAGCGGNYMSYSWSVTGESHTLGDNNWTITASTVNGHASRNVNLTSDNLTALHVKNTNSNGKVSLALTQGNAEKTFDVSGTFDGNIDASSFTPGKITIRLNFENAKTVDVAVNW